MRTVVVDVTEEDIRNGKRCEGRECALALAIRRTGLDAKVGWENIWIYRDNEEPHPVSLNVDAFKFREDFDHCRPVSPFSFTLELPEGV